MKDLCYRLASDTSAFILSTLVDRLIKEEGWIPVGGMIPDIVPGNLGGTMKVYTQALYRPPIKEIALTPEGREVFDQIKNGATTVNGVDISEEFRQKMLRQRESLEESGSLR